MLHVLNFAWLSPHTQAGVGLCGLVLGEVYRRHRSTSAALVTPVCAFPLALALVQHRAPWLATVGLPQPPRSHHPTPNDTRLVALKRADVDVKARGGSRHHVSA